MSLQSVLFMLLVCSASALQIGVAPRAAARASIRMEGAINDIIDKENPKVVNVVPVSEIKGKKAVYCRCWKSKVFPVCDASHVKHNEECGDNVGPLIIEKD